MGHRFGFLKNSFWKSFPFGKNSLSDRSETGIGFVQRLSNQFVLIEQIYHGLVDGEMAVAGGGEIGGEMSGMSQR